MPGVRDAPPPAGIAERLTRTGAGPYWPLIFPSCEPEREGPAADSGEEMALIVPNEITRPDVSDISVIDMTSRDQPPGNQIAQPRHAVGIVLVVIRRHAFVLTRSQEQVKKIALPIWEFWDFWAGSQDDSVTCPKFFLGKNERQAPNMHPARPFALRRARAWRRAGAGRPRPGRPSLHHHRIMYHIMNVNSCNFK